MQLRQAIPLLRIFDVASARDFYLGFLGFGVDWEHRFEPGAPLYLQVSRDGCVLISPSTMAIAAQEPRFSYMSTAWKSFTLS